MPISPLPERMAPFCRLVLAEMHLFGYIVMVTDDAFLLL